MSTGDKKPQRFVVGEQNSAFFDVVAIASSAGGLRALNHLLSHLPRNFPVAIIVVQHLDRSHRSLLPEILARGTALEVRPAIDGDRLRTGVVYIAPPNYHLLVKPGGVLSLSQTDLVNFVRPSADILFESVAASFDARAIAVILTGTGKDGASGAEAVKAEGGVVIAQDKASSEFFGMPGSAIMTGDVDFILPLKDIADALVKLVEDGELK